MTFVGPERPDGLCSGGGPDEFVCHRDTTPPVGSAQFIPLGRQRSLDRTGDMSWLDAFDEATRETIPARLVRPPRPEGEPYTGAELGLPERMGSRSPLVSVVVPTYGDSHCLPEALQSVGRQRNTPLEVVVVDSSGVDWLESLAASREWIRYRYQEPRGVAAARNTGIEEATGRYVALLDADDYWHPAKLDTQVPVLEAGRDAVFSDYYVVNFRGGGSPSVTYQNSSYDSPETAYADRILRQFAHTSSLVFRRTAPGVRPFEESLQTREDLAFLVDLFTEAPPAHVDEPLVVHRKRRGSLTDRVSPERTYEHQKAAVEYLSSRHPELSTHTERRLARAAYVLGNECLEANDKQAARTYLAKSLADPWRNYKALALYGATLVPVSGATSARTLTALYRWAVGHHPAGNDVSITRPST